MGTNAAIVIDGPVRFSHLRAYGRSGMHGLYSRMGDEYEETPAIERGTAVHAMVFDTRPVIGYSGVRRGKGYDEFAAEHVNYEILTQNEYVKAKHMADSVRESQVAAPYLKGVAETTLLFKWMGQDCRVTPDMRGENFVTELKTCANADPTQFYWDAIRRHYHAQLAYQRIGCGANDYVVEDAYIVCVESAPPYPVVVHRVTERALEVGEKLLMLWMERLNICERSKQWPGYVESVVELDVVEEQELEFADE